MPDPYRYRVEQSVPGVEWRRVNQDYLESSGTIPPASERLQILQLSPWTRTQRLLHRLRICRWHRHGTDLTRAFDWRIIRRDSTVDRRPPHG